MVKTRVVLTVPRALVAAVPATNKMPFDFEVKKSHRRTLAIEVRAGKVIVRSPLFISAATISRFVDEKADWIGRKIIETQSRQDKQDESRIKYLGIDYEVKFDEIERVHFDSESRVLFIPRKKRELVKTQLRRFFLQQTAQLVRDIIKDFEADFDLENAKINFKFFKSKWGSCSGKNNLSFNGYLASVPFEVIRYVVVHELCHIRHKNHQKQYWREVESYDRDYKEHRKYLRNHHIKII